MTTEIKRTKLIGTKGEVHNEVQPDHVSIQFAVDVDPVDGHPQLLSVSLDIDVTVTETEGPFAGADVDWASVGARYAVELGQAPPGEFGDEEFRQVLMQIWPYLRSHCLAVAAQLGIDIEIPFAADSVVAAAQPRES